MTKIHT
jgi:hypothetical protein